MSIYVYVVGRWRGSGTIRNTCRNEFRSLAFSGGSRKKDGEIHDGTRPGFGCSAAGQRIINW